MEVVVSPVRLVFNVDAINGVDVAANWLYLTGGPASVVRINLDAPTQVRDIVLPRKAGETAGFIRQVYTNPSGSAVLAITSRNEHFFYQQRHSPGAEPPKAEFKALAKLRGTSTICASFHPVKPNVFLLGTRAGNIVEVSVDSSANETYFKRDLKFAAQIWKSPQKDPVRSLLVMLDSRKRPQVLATCGPNVFEWRFGSINPPASASATDSLFQGLFEVLPRTVAQGKRPHSLVASPNGEHWGVVLSGSTIALADRSRHSGSDKSGNSDTERGNWHEVEVSDRVERLLLSDYYALAITSKSGVGLNVVTVNLFDHQQITSYPVPDEAQITGAVTDRRESTFWIYNEETLMELKLENELEGMWKSLADQRRFAEALAIANTSAQKSRILVMNARQEVIENNFREAAQLFGSSDAPLEVAALELMQKTNDDPEVISALLLARLKRTKSRAQQTMLTAWLAELGELSWLNESQIAWDVDIVCHSLKQRGEFDKLVPILTGIGDIESAVSVLVTNEQYSDALDLLRQHEHLPSLYKYASVLLDNEPRATVESWMRITGLDSTKLVPILLQFSQKYRGPAKENQALRFLKFAIKQPQSQINPIFNAIVVILATNIDATSAVESAVNNTSPSGSSELLDFLQKYAPQLDDHDFALRTCIQHHQIEAAVYLSTLMDLFEDAVQLCLSTNDPKMLDKAVEIADKKTVAGPGNNNSNNEELRKILLREIAQKLIKDQGPQAAIRFTKLLRVDDLLAQFPDFETLNELAPEIVKSLEQTNARLSSLNAEINDSLSASENMQRELQEFKRKSVLVEPGEACYLCDFPLITRKFVVFPCQHGFHLDCIKKNNPGRPVTEECVLCSVDNLKQLDMPLNSVF